MTLQSCVLSVFIVTKCNWETLFKSWHIVECCSSCTLLTLTCKSITPFFQFDSDIISLLLHLSRSRWRLQPCLWSSHDWPWKEWIMNFVGRSSFGIIIFLTWVDNPASSSRRPCRRPRWTQTYLGKKPAHKENPIQGRLAHILAFWNQKVKTEINDW